MANASVTATNEVFDWKQVMIKRLPFLLVIAVIVLVADQASKYWAVKNLTHSFGDQSDWQRFMTAIHPVPKSGITIIGGMWDFQYVENPGAAWGLLSRASESFRVPFFLVVSLVASCLILYYYLKAPAHMWMRRWAFALVFGGAIGNFIDRIRLGYVIDFIDWHWRDSHWPTFNVADAAISIGVALLLIESFTMKEEKSA